MSNQIDPEVMEKLLKLLDKPYKRAKLGILNLESKSKKYSFSQILQLRDALDHISIALVEHSGEKEKQLKSLDLAEDHLRRASIESIEILVTELFFSMLGLLEKPRIYYKFAFCPLPEKYKIDAQLKKIEYHLKRGRQLKGKIDDWELCLMEFEKAYNETVILKNLLPHSNEAKYRFFVILITIMAFTVSVAVAVISHFV